MRTRIRQLVMIAGLFMDGEARRAMRTWKPFSITSYRMMNVLQASAPHIRTIIDGGANVGQFSRAARETFPDADVFAFEPLEDVAAQFRRNLGGEKRVRLIRAALGDDVGETTFYRNDYTLASSVLPQDPEHHKRFPETSGVKQLTVPLTTLDCALESEDMKSPVLLKLDLQGYELPALRGGIKTLAECDMLLIETPFKALYQGEAVFEDILLFLKDHGFSFDRPIDFLTDRTGEIVQMDALFVRR